MNESAPAMTKLCIFDENQQHQQFDIRKILIDKIGKQLLLTPNTDTKLISLSFKMKYLRHKSILLICPSQDDPLSYVFVLKSDNQSKFIFDAVEQGKKRTVTFMDEVIEVKQSFYNLLAGTNIDRNLFDDLIEGVKVTEEPEEITQMDTGSSQMDTGSSQIPVQDHTDTATNVVQPLRRSSRLQVVEKELADTVDDDGNALQADEESKNKIAINEERCLRKRRRPSQRILEANIDDENNDLTDTPNEREPKPKKQRKNALPPMDEIIRAPNFAVINYIEMGISKSRLFVFPSSDRTRCYRYFYDFAREIYVCCSCNNGKCTRAIIEHDSDGTAFIRCRKNDHTCTLREYEPERFKTDYVIRKPNFDFIEENGNKKKFLLLFTSADKKKFYKFHWDNGQKMYKCMKCCKARNYIQACVCKDENGAEYISVRNRKHICSEMEYLVAEKPTTVEATTTAKVPEYHHVVRNKFKVTPSVSHPSRRRMPRSSKPSDPMLINTPTSPSISASPESSRKSASKSSKTPQIQSRNSNPIQIHQPSQVSDASKIVKKPFYRLVKRNFRGKWLQKLIIFDPLLKSMCREYTWIEIHKIFACSQCRWKYNKFLSAKVIQNEDGEECVQLGSNNHLCGLKKFVE